MQLGLVVADGGTPIPVSALSPQASRELLADRLGPAFDTVPEETVERALAQCGGWALALTLMAARAGTLTTTPLNDTGLLAAGGDDPLADLGLPMRLTYDSLSPRAQSAARALSGASSPLLTLADLASLLEMSAPDAAQIAAELDRAFVLLASGDVWFLHNLVKDFATRVAAEPDAYRS